jgi:hypothetical protein
MRDVSATESSVQSAIDLGRQIEVEIERVFSRPTYLSASDQDWLSIAMAVRCLGLLRGVLLCAEARNADPAMVIARALLEQRFVMRALFGVADDAVTSKRWHALLRSTEHTRAKIASKLRSLSGEHRDERVTDALLAELEGTIAVDRRETTVLQWALWADLEPLYQTAYASLSLHAHPSYLTVDAMVTKNEQLWNVSASPHQERLAMAILQSADAMVDAMQLLPRGYLDVAQHEHFQAVSSRLKQQWAELPEQPLSPDAHREEALSA